MAMSDTLRLALATCLLQVTAAFECYEDCNFPFRKKDEETRWFLGICCGESPDDCCELDAGALVGGIVFLLIVIVCIMLISCGCCGCCPFYKMLPCSKCGVGCCIPPGQAPGGQGGPVVVGQPV
eukprot:6415931-Amphidinium_carterae.1